MLDEAGGASDPSLTFLLESDGTVVLCGFQQELRTLSELKNQILQTSLNCP